MIKKKFKTLKFKKNNLLAPEQVLVEEEHGYEIFIDNVAFFAYNEIGYGWIIVDQRTGISFSRHFKTRNEAIKDMMKKMKDYNKFVQTKEYQELLIKYNDLINTNDAIIDGQLSIYDYE